MADSSLLSVIMPVLNGEKFLAEAVASVRRSPGPLEIIIVDDGSTDQTAAIVKGCDNLIYIRQETAGPAVARNRGLQMAHGDLIGFLDADDVWAHGHPEKALRYFQSHGETDLVLGQTMCLTASSADGDDFAPSGKPFHSYQLGAAIVRRRLIEEMGGFNSTMRYGEDVDWFLRARERGTTSATLPEVALYYRLHAGNQPNVYRTSREGLLNAFHHSLQRRRSLSAPETDRGNTRPLVSVVIPVYNGECFIAEAIASVIAQDYRPLELIVVDDGSIDRTREIVKDISQATLLEQPHQGAGAARNAGVRASKGEFVAFLDADDVWNPGKLFRQIEAFVAEPGLEAIFGHVVEFHEGETDADSAPLPSPIPGTMLIKRAAFERIGWFSDEPTALEGVDWYLRASEKSLRSRMLPDVLYRRRIHGRNRSIVNRDHDGYLRAIKASLDRRRTSPKNPIAHVERH
jgi:glycosyltransferase involved in cell wall biosynthesis